MQGGQCYFMIMLSLCTPTNEGSEGLRERERDEKQRRGERADSTSPAPTWWVFFFFLFCLLCDMVLLFQPTGSTCRQNGNLYCNNCSKFACPLMKRAVTLGRNSSEP